MKRILAALMVLMLAFGLASATVMGQDGCWDSNADSVSDYVQGTEKDGSPVQSGRSNPLNALGPIDKVFFSLGYVDEESGGRIIVEFGDYVGTCLTVVEQSPGTGYGYPLEQAEVYVSADSENPTNWTYLGIANNQIAPGSETGQSHQNTFTLEECIKFVKIVDITDPTPHGNTADAFDLDAVGAGPCSTPEVEIDIKPGSYPNCFNINGHGVIPVAILGSDDFDVNQIDVSTLMFAGLVVRVKGKGTPQCSVEDVSGDFTYPEGAPDGFDDLVCQFVDDAEGWAPDNGTATVTGSLYDGSEFTGTDSICVRPE